MPATVVEPTHCERCGRIASPPLCVPCQDQLQLVQALERLTEAIDRLNAQQRETYIRQRLREQEQR